MSSTLASVARQLADKICNVITGPVVGTVTAAATAGDVELAIGQMATITGGRRVRVIKRTKVRSAGTAVPVRLEWLAPSIPARANFSAVANGTVATWVSPPAGIVATGTTNAFGMGPLAGDLKIGSYSEHDQIDSPADLFAAGAVGTAALVLLSPTIRRIGSDNFIMTGLYEATWRLRLALNDTGENKERRTRVRDSFTALVQAMHGGAAGDDYIRVGDFKPVKEAGWGLAWEASILTRLEVDGVPLLETNEDLDEVGITVKIPGDLDQPSPFQVLEDVEAAG